MPTPEEYLRQDVGVHLSTLIFQTAVLKGEVDRLKAEVDRLSTEIQRQHRISDDHVPHER